MKITKKIILEIFYFQFHYLILHLYNLQNTAVVFKKYKNQKVQY